MIESALKKLYWMLFKHLDYVKYILYLRFLALNNLISRRSLTSAYGPVVSLTSYGGRVDSVFLTIESIAQGKLLPSRLILWIDDQRIFSDLPVSLRRLQKRGLDIRKCENFGPHTKYFGYVESEATFSKPVVTADDDVIYPRFWLGGLVAAFAIDAKVINCYRARSIKIKDGKFLPYDMWPLCTTTEASFSNFGTGVSGVIYPPEFLLYLKNAGRDFMRSCPKADDIWLHVSAIRSGWKVRQISDQALELKMIPGSQEQALKLQNQYSEGNDRAIASTYSKEDIDRLVSCPESMQ